jgi:hypothetical protein
MRSLAHIREPRIRALALGEKLHALTADDILTVIKRLNELHMRGSAEAHDLLACFRDTQAFEARLGLARMRELATAAEREGNEVAALLIAPIERVKGGGNKTHKDLRDMTLGERKALAKSHSKDMLVKLLEDDHPHVQANLLANPRISVREVIAVAAKRGVQPHILRGIATHARWMHNYEVRRALVKNPDTPLDVAGRLVVTLQRSDLEEVAIDERLNPRVRALGTERLERLRVSVVYRVDADDE